VIRGGAFLSSPRNLETALRDIENARSNRVGFRLVRELP
jgi:formylglycine-generating enzyme required for sulfatase activity